MDKSCHKYQSLHVNDTFSIETKNGESLSVILSRIYASIQKWCRSTEYIHEELNRETTMHRFWKKKTRRVIMAQKCIASCAAACTSQLFVLIRATDRSLWNLSIFPLVVAPNNGCWRKEGMTKYVHVHGYDSRYVFQYQLVDPKQYKRLLRFLHFQYSALADQHIKKK